MSSPNPQGPKNICGMQQTSIEAYIELVSDPDRIRGRRREVLLGLYRLGAATDRELAEYLGYDDPNCVRPRRNELADADRLLHPLVEKYGYKHCPVSGKKVCRWRLSHYGRLFVSEIMEN